MNDQQTQRPPSQERGRQRQRSSSSHRIEPAPARGESRRRSSSSRRHKSRNRDKEPRKWSTSKLSTASAEKSCTIHVDIDTPNIEISVMAISIGTYKKPPAVYYLFKVSIWEPRAIEDNLEIKFHILQNKTPRQVEVLKVSPKFLPGAATLVETTRTKNVSGGVQQVASISTSIGDQSQWAAQHRWTLECTPRAGTVQVQLRRTGPKAPSIPTQFYLQFVTPYKQNDLFHMACDVDWNPKKMIGYGEDGWTGSWHEVDLPRESDPKTDWDTWAPEDWKKGSEDNTGFDHRSVVPFPLFSCLISLLTKKMQPSFMVTERAR